MKKLVIASGNAGKLREIEAILAPLGCEVLTQAALGIADAPEPHLTFIENALAKARHAAGLAGLPALADDSGVCVPALGGEPGVHSARYGGNAISREERDARNNDKLGGARPPAPPAPGALGRHRDQPRVARRPRPHPAGSGACRRQPSPRLAFLGHGAGAPRGR